MDIQTIRSCLTDFANKYWSDNGLEYEIDYNTGSNLWDLVNYLETVAWDHDIATLTTRTERIVRCADIQHAVDIAQLDEVKALAFALVEEQKDWCNLPKHLNLPHTWILLHELFEVCIVNCPCGNLDKATKLAVVDYSIPGDYDENVCH